MNKEKLLNILIIILIIALVTVVIYRFKIIKKQNNIFELKQFEKINLTDFNGRKHIMRNLLKKDNYILVFTVIDCSFCINKGVNELIYFLKKNKNCFGIIIHDRPEEISGWANNFSFHRFYIMKKDDYYNIFSNKFTPVLINMYKNKIKWYKYITP
jgi:hypothetical protein